MRYDFAEDLGENRSRPVVSSTHVIRYLNEGDPLAWKRANSIDACRLVSVSMSGKRAYTTSKLSFCLCNQVD
ncbi:hypothetical protein OUZ56_022641 [Daphnia magna]|uniref:Uncharacterized protein n=1 Tax=Daphnia magna TaxID=35525 RepID=A0ABR0AX32_9CRUS|nr:hypothetical protein OUZ56_022641 [Daphnia magna]